MRNKFSHTSRQHVQTTLEYNDFPRRYVYLTICGFPQTVTNFQGYVMEPPTNIQIAEAYRSVWQHEDTLRNQRVNRFWLINAAFFAAVCFIFCSQDFTNFLSHSFHENQTQKSSETCGKLKISFNQLTFTVKMETTPSPEFAESVSLSECFRLKWLLVLCISVIGTINAAIFIHQANIGETAFNSLNDGYKAYNTTIPINGIFISENTCKGFFEKSFSKIVRGGSLKRIVGDGEILRGILFFGAWILVSVCSWLELRYPSSVFDIVEYCIANPVLILSAVLVYFVVIFILIVFVFLRRK